jgi:hypothetical protein
MSGDYSRWGFDPKRDYNGVLLMQGRPLTDRDWNDGTLQGNRRVQAGTLDAVGQTFVSTTHPDAFKIESDGSGGLRILRGRIYVDGLLADNHGTGAKKWDPALAELYGDAPTPYATQPYLPNPKPLPASGGPHLVYLDVWQREVTQFQDPGLVEQALGVDTTTRLQTVWQVKVLENVGAGVTCATPPDQIAAWKAATTPSAGRLSTDTVSVGQPDPCLLPPGAGYKGLENQLYRVEIHTAGPLGTAKFKWSRDNASVETRVTRIIDPTHIVVESVGKDDVLRFSDGHWVEITDDWRELNNLPGELRRIKIGGGVEDGTRVITLTQGLPAGMFPVDASGKPDPARHTRLRRWDQTGKILDKDGNPFADLDLAGSDGLITVPPGGKVLQIENGLTVTFSTEAGGDFRVGDHWMFAARTSEPYVEILDKAPPHGVHHHFAKLAMYTPPSTIEDCRPLGGGGCCEVVVAPGENIQKAIDSLAPEGGSVCLQAGVHVIHAALQIAQSNVTLTGESTGAIVRRDDGYGMVAIGGAANTDVMVETIHFHHTGDKSDASAAITIEGTDRVRVRNCLFSSDHQLTGAMARIEDCQQVTVEDCSVAGYRVGLWITDDSTEVDTLRCHFHAAAPGKASNDDTGLVGIWVEGAMGPCRVEDSVFEGFCCGVALDSDSNDALDDPGAHGSRIAGNQILRSQPFTDLQTAGPVYGIDIGSERCTVSGNRLVYASAAYGGIRLGGDDGLAENNHVEAFKGPEIPGRTSVGIQLGYDAANAAPTGDRSVARGNHVRGSQIGIYVDHARAVAVSDNAINSEAAPYPAIAVVGAIGARIDGNRVVGHAGGLGLMFCAASEITDNLFSSGSGGSATYFNLDTQMRGNVTESMRGIGHLGMFEFGRTRYVGEIFRNCGYDAQQAVHASLMLFGAVECTVENCSVTDTGVEANAPNAKPVQPAIGIWIWTTQAHIHGNAVGFTDATKLAAGLEDRALYILGPLSAMFSPQITSDVGMAHVTDNRFAGVGAMALVEIPDLRGTTTRLAFGRVTFSDNFCDHRAEKKFPNSATVSLASAAMVVNGNQCRAISDFPSFNLNSCQLAIYIANIASGNPLNYPVQHPAPQTQFNIAI